MRLSPDGGLVAYRNEDGLYVVKADGTEKQLLLPPRAPVLGGKYAWLSEGRLDDYAWSPDGRRLLVKYQHEMEAEFFLCNIETKEIKPVNTVFKDYSFHRVVGWPDEHLLVFNTVSHKKKDGTVEYAESGHRWDLALYDLSTGECSLITNADDGEFIVGTAAGKSGILFERRYKGKDVETRGFIDFAGRVVWEEDLGNVMRAAVSPGGNNLAYVVMAKEERNRNKVCKLVVETGAETLEVRNLPVGDTFTGP
ncbi:MAG TPA: hypothetical protein EYP19_12960, partial [Desulfobacterales bacterium]|nr:hypothetical protein [Desulfobacterales bacterium]